MKVYGRRGRLSAVVRLLTLTYVVFWISLSSEKSAVVNSFALRDDGQMDLTENKDDDDDDDNLEDNFSDQWSPFDIERMKSEDDQVYNTPERYENFDQSEDENLNVFDNHNDDDEEEVFDQGLMETVGENDISDKNSNEESQDTLRQEQHLPDDSSTTLDKAELYEIFDSRKPISDEGQSEIAASEKFQRGAGEAEESAKSPVSTADNKTKLSKNEVEHLFDQVSNADLLDNENSAFLSQPSAGVVVATGVNLSLTNDAIFDLTASIPTIKVTTVEEMGSDEKTNESGEEQVTPYDNEDNEDGKTIEEWMVELTQPGVEEWKATEDGRAHKSKKFKRSPRLPYDEGEYQSITEIPKYNVAKSRAVDLLTTYIKLQHDENRHLTEALDLATRGQTEVSAEYIAPQVEHLRQAVNDERAMEKIRDSLRDEKSDQRATVFENGDELYTVGPPEDEEDMNSEIFHDIVNVDLDEDPKRVFRRNQFVADIKTEENHNEGDMELPIISFDDDNSELDYDGDEDQEYSQREFQENDDDEIMRARLLQFEDQWERLNHERQAAEWEKINRLVERGEELPSRTTHRGRFRFNPFLRDQKVMYRKQGVHPMNKRRNVLPDQMIPLYYEAPPVVDDIVEEPDALESLETLQRTVGDNVMVQTRNLHSAMCPSVQALTDNCLVARERGLVLDDEALKLCNRHQLCYSCGIEYGLTPEICDRGYLLESDLLCTKADKISGMVPGHPSKLRCKADAASLYVIMLDGHRYYDVNYGFSIPPSCQHPCTYNFIVGTSEGSSGGF